MMLSKGMMEVDNVFSLSEGRVSNFACSTAQNLLTLS